MSNTAAVSLPIETATPEAPVEPVPAAPKADPTSYVLLALNESTGEWLVTNESVSAKSGEAAIKLHAENTKTGSPDGTYVAVPSRSWRLFTIATKTTTTLVIGEAS